MTITKKQKDGGPVVGIYHSGCIDGTTAAAVLLKKFPHAKLFPLKHYRKPKDINNILKKTTPKTIIYIVDFSITPQELQKFTKKAFRVVNIDHHVGVKERLEHLQKKFKNYTFIFNNSRSGASLTWLSLFKKPIPTLIRYVEENDIHKGHWQASNVAYTTSYLSQFVNQPEKIKAFIGSKSALKKILMYGKVLTAYNATGIKQSLENYNPIMVRVGKYTIRSYNSPEFLRSYIGHTLSKKYRQAVAVFALSGDTVRFHFRSEDGQKPTALTLAQTLHGNGHKNAAGARVLLKDFLKMVRY